MSTLDTKLSTLVAAADQQLQSSLDAPDADDRGRNGSSLMESDRVAKTWSARIQGNANDVLGPGSRVIFHSVMLDRK